VKHAIRTQAPNALAILALFALALVRHYLKVEGLTHELSVATDDLTPQLLAKVKPASPQFMNGIVRGAKP